MKFRNGFVSNSSSSSFIVLLPDNFPGTVNYDHVPEEDRDGMRNLVTMLVQQGYIYQDDLHQVEEGYEYMEEILGPYIIASLDTGPDDGQWIVADKNKVRELL